MASLMTQTIWTSILNTQFNFIPANISSDTAAWMNGSHATQWINCVHIAASSWLKTRWERCPWVSRLCSQFATASGSDIKTTWVYYTPHWWKISCVRILDSMTKPDASLPWLGLSVGKLHSTFVHLPLSEPWSHYSLSSVFQCTCVPLPSSCLASIRASSTRFSWHWLFWTSLPLP